VGDDDNEALAPHTFTWSQTADAPNLLGTTEVKINASTGDINLTWAALIAEGGFNSDHQRGVATLGAGGTVIVPARNADIRPPQLTRDTPSGGLGQLSCPTATRTATQFVINSNDATERSTIVWEIPPMRRPVVICQANAKT
jgi:hypothetical protein